MCGFELDHETYRGKINWQKMRPFFKANFPKAPVLQNDNGIKLFLFQEK